MQIVYIKTHLAGISHVVMPLVILYSTFKELTFKTLEWDLIEIEQSIVARTDSLLYREKNYMDHTHDIKIAWNNKTKF